MRAPLISVLLPVHNGVPYIERAVNSVLEQTFEDFELLVLDDGSTDGTTSTLDSFSSRDSRVRVLKTSNGGLVKALNTLLEQARGAFIARMDADDVCLPDRLALQLAFLQAHPDVGCVGGAFELIDAADRPITVLKPPVANDEIQEALLRGHGAITHPAAMMRRAVLDATGGYRPEFFPAEDLDLWLRIGEASRLANLPDVVLQYRLHDGSVSERNQAAQRERAAAVCRAACERRGVQRPFEAAQAWRPTSTRPSRHAFALRYGWWAHGSDNADAARFYAMRAMRLRPFALDTWRLAYCVFAKSRRRVGEG